MRRPQLAKRALDVTLSGVGLTDILPVSPPARALVMLEAFAGVMYIALVVSRLIGLTILRRQDRPPAGTP